MLSLYIHIPFCAHKCSYCSFFVLPEDQVEPWKVDLQKEKYLSSLLAEIQEKYKQYWKESLKTIYIWWGTPFQLWTKRLFTLIDSLLETWDTEFLEELTIELNPDPIPEVLAFVEEAAEKYKDLYKLRFSIGIQTFDDQLLSKSKRNYHYNNLPGFLRKLQPLKKPNMAYSADFIAFGKFKVDDEWTEYLWDVEKTEFFINMVKSKLFDGFSLYTLELMQWSDWHNEAMHTAKAAQKIYGNDENILDEFHFLRKIFEYHGYKRYEISNFALRGKESIHNIVYRTWWSYLWLWINASSYLDQKIRGEYGLPKDTPKDSPQEALWTWTRFKNTAKRNEYLTWDYTDTGSLEHISEKEQLREQAMMQLRTTGIKDIKAYTAILSTGREEKIATWKDEWLCIHDENTFVLTSAWMNVYNTILTELFTFS